MWPPCGMADCWCFEETFCLHVRGRRVGQAIRKYEGGRSLYDRHVNCRWEQFNNFLQFCTWLSPVCCYFKPDPWAASISMPFLVFSPFLSIHSCNLAGTMWKWARWQASIKCGAARLLQRTRACTRPHGAPVSPQLHARDFGCNGYRFSGPGPKLVNYGLPHSLQVHDEVLHHSNPLLYPSKSFVFTTQHRSDIPRSRSYFTTDGRSVSQYVLVSSTLVGLATRYYFLSESCCLKFAVLYQLGALSHERTGLQFAA
jgi:hypothetical protein